MSFPDSDYYLQWLINSAISSQNEKSLIVVVNKDKKVFSKVNKLFKNTISYCESFDSFIDNVKK